MGGLVALYPAPLQQAVYSTYVLELKQITTTNPSDSDEAIINLPLVPGRWYLAAVGWAEPEMPLAMSSNGSCAAVSPTGTPPPTTPDDCCMLHPTKSDARTLDPPTMFQPTACSLASHLLRASFGTPVAQARPAPASPAIQPHPFPHRTHSFHPFPGCP